MTSNTYFQRVIFEPHPDHLVAPEKISRHIFCSGQVYYALLRARDKNNFNDVAITRIEQLNPFPYEFTKEAADRYPNAQIVFAQVFDS